MPFSRRKSTMRNFRSSRLARSLRQSAVRAGHSGPRCRPSMCMCRSSAAPSSTPRSTVRPRAVPARTASSAPSMVSWSVTASTWMPAAAAFSTSAAGAYCPSDAVEWVWRSARTVMLSSPCGWQRSVSPAGHHFRRGRSRSAPVRTPRGTPPPAERRSAPP